MKPDIEKLKSGESYIVPESDYGKAQVWKVINMLILFEIPFLGGEPIYIASFHKDNIDKLIAEIESWT